MSNITKLQDAIRYELPGTLIRPRTIGRLVRLFMGCLCLWVTWELATKSVVADLSDPSWWFLIAIGLLLIKYVVNIGFGISIGAWPLNLSLMLIAFPAMASYLFTGVLFSTSLWLTATVWMVYVYGHLGISFLLSSVLATPGCEMRAIPHMFGILKGKDAAEHYCPAFIDNIDKWEHTRHTNQNQVEKLDHDDPRTKDILRNGGQILLFFGIPFIALQIAGNLGNFTVATIVSAVAFIFVSLVSFVNILRCKRIYCYFLAPWFLTAGVALGLYNFRLIDLGPNTWSIIVNTALVGGICLSMHINMGWGQYLEKK